MNEDDIQPEMKGATPSRSCGLVMNEDDIQPRSCLATTAWSCGLVMNEDDIQLIVLGCQSTYVVVW